MTQEETKAKAKVLIEKHYSVSEGNFSSAIRHSILDTQNTIRVLESVKSWCKGLSKTSTNILIDEQTQILDELKSRL